MHKIVDDQARLFSQYTHGLFVNTMLVSPHATPSAELFERTDSYYIYLKPDGVSDRDILREARFYGAPPVWIPMPAHWMRSEAARLMRASCARSVPVSDSASINDSLYGYRK